MSKSEYLLGIIADAFESTPESILAEATFDSVCPGICIKCEGVIDACEPDAVNNWCDECDKPTVRSALVLGGII